MLETFHWFRGEGFGLIVAELLRLPAETGVIAEGFRLLPHLVKPLLAEFGHAVWLLPTPEFRSAAFGNRAAAWDIPRKTGNPERARRNLLERDRMFTDRRSEETKRFGLPVIEIGTAMSEDELAGQVTQAFGLRGGTRGTRRDPECPGDGRLGILRDGKVTLIRGQDQHLSPNPAAW